MNHNRLKLFNFKWSSILRFKKKLTCRHSAKRYNIGYYIDPSSEKMEFYSYIESIILTEDVIVIQNYN